MRDSNFSILVASLLNTSKGCTLHLSPRKLDKFKVNEHNTRNYFVAKYQTGPSLLTLFLLKDSNFNS